MNFLTMHHSAPAAEQNRSFAACSSLQDSYLAFKVILVRCCFSTLALKSLGVT